MRELKARWRAREFEAKYRGCELTVFAYKGRWRWEVERYTGPARSTSRLAMLAAERFVDLAKVTERSRPFDLAKVTERSRGLAGSSRNRDAPDESPPS
jgi:hypothetical protein